MCIDSIVIRDDELLLRERGDLKAALQQYHHLEVLRGRKVMQSPSPKGWLIGETALSVFLLFLVLVLTLTVLSSAMLGQISLPDFFRVLFLLAIGLFVAVDILRSRHHNSFIGGCMIRLLFPFDRLILRKKFHIRSLAGRCLRFTRAGCYILPLKDEAACEQALETIQKKSVPSVPRENFSPAEHSQDRIMLVAFHRWHRLKLIDRPRSVFLERTICAADWDRILAKLEELGYFASK